MSQFTLHAVVRKQVQDIRETYLGIHATLENLDEQLREVEIAHNASKEISMNVTDQELVLARQLILQQVQYDIIGRLQAVAGHSETFWLGYSWRPDNYFWNRKLPAIDNIKTLDKPKAINIDEIDKEETQLKRVSISADGKTDQAKLPRSERIRARRNQYDIREAVTISPSATVRTALLNQTVTIRNSEVKFYTGESDDRFRPADISTYYNSLTADTAIAIFQQLRKYRLFAAMLATYQAIASSQMHCHLAFAKPIIDALFDAGVSEEDANESKPSPFSEPKYLSAIHHAQHYALTLLHREESIANGWADDQHRFILDAATVEKIPRLNYKTTTHPWVPMNLNPEQMINPENPLRIEEADSKYRGFHPMNVFEIRYEIFHEGSLNGLNMDRIQVVGSVIPSCLIRSPLELQFGIHCDRTDIEYWRDPDTQCRLRRYFDEYYPSKNVLKGWEHITREELIEIEDELTDIDLVVNADNDRDYHMIVSRIYETIRKNLLLTMSSLSSEDLQILKMKTFRSYKYYISGRAIGRSYEIFRFAPGEPTLAGVSRFHFPSVRATYDGYTFKVLPSCFVYAMTGVMTGYRWFSVNENCLSGVMKYYSRGGYLPMNSGEIEGLKKYLDGPGKLYWDHVLHFTKLGFNHPLYRPREKGVGLHGKYRHKDQNGVLPPYMVTRKHHEYDLYDATPKIDEWPSHLEFRFAHGNIVPWSYQRAMRDVRDLVFSKRHQTADTPITVTHEPVVAQAKKMVAPAKAKKPAARIADMSDAED